jgi:membrane protein YqaA with SNARE-associated domain
MDLLSLAWVAIAAVGLGAVATYLMATWIPARVASMAAEHGRFVGLGEPEHPVAPQSRQRQREAMNVVRTAN